MKDYNIFDSRLYVALPKGRLMERAYELFAQAGLRSRAFENGFDNGKYEYRGKGVTFWVQKAPDVPGIVDAGDVDMGVCGFDSMREYQLSNVMPNGSMGGRNFVSGVVGDLGISEMNFCVAGKAAEREEYFDRIENDMPLVIATAYPKVMRAYFQKKYPNVLIDIAEWNGSVESGMKLCGADAIFDIVETGNTLKKNGLQVFETAFGNATKLLLSRTALRKDKRVLKVAQQIKQNVLKGEE